MDLQPIPESQFEGDPQELIDKILKHNRILEKRCNYLRRRRDLLLQALSYVDEPKQKLADSKVSEVSVGCNLSTLADESDMHQKYLEDLQARESLISELTEKVESLETKIQRLQACNEEMQYQLQQQQPQKPQEFVRNNHLSQTVMIPKSTSQTEKAQAAIERFGQPISTSSFKSTDGKTSAEDRKKQLKRLSLGASASAYMMSARGDYLTLQGASDEVKSAKSIDQ